MNRIHDPCQVTHPRIREFAIQAAWFCTIVEAASDIEYLLDDAPPDVLIPPNLEDSPWPWDVDPMLVALSVIRKAYQAVEEDLAERLSDWLGEDQENWPVLRLTMIMPWQERPGAWHKDTLSWLLLLSEKADAVLRPGLV